MKYQALKRLKTKTKLLKLCDTLKEAHEVITADGGNFVGFNYMGGFPVYANSATERTWSIQGQVEGLGIVCSINKDELQAFDFASK